LGGQGWSRRGAAAAYRLDRVHVARFPPRLGEVLDRAPGLWARLPDIDREPSLAALLIAVELDEVRHVGLREPGRRRHRARWLELASRVTQQATSRHGTVLAAGPLVRLTPPPCRSMLKTGYGSKSGRGCAHAHAHVCMHAHMPLGWIDGERSASARVRLCAIGCARLGRCTLSVQPPTCELVALVGRGCSTGCLDER